MRYASSNEVCPSLSKSASALLMASAKCPPKRVKFTSCPLRVAVTTMRPGAASLLMNGPLADAQFTTAMGRLNAFSHSASSPAPRSGPRRLKRASLPSNVPWPSSTSHTSPAPSFASASNSTLKRARSFVSADRPMVTSFACACVATFSHFAAASANCLPNSSSPGAPTRTKSVGLSATSARAKQTVTSKMDSNSFTATPSSAAAPTPQ